MPTREQYSGFRRGQVHLIRPYTMTLSSQAANVATGVFNNPVCANVFNVVYVHAIGDTKVTDALTKAGPCLLSHHPALEDAIFRYDWDCDCGASGRLRRSAMN
jgi:hypothetical protein